MSAGTSESRSVATIRAVVADDEPIAREYLKLMLNRAGGVEVVAEAQEASECLSKVAESTPDVVFLDIQLPDESGLEVARALAELKEPPLIVFVTGYEQYAVPAFEVAAADYVTKPYSQERLEKTLARVRSRIDRTNGNRAVPPLALGRLTIRDKEGAKLIPIDDICYINTRGRKVIVHTSSEEHSTHYTLAELEQRLRDYRFFRAYEGCLVNLDKVQEVVYYGSRSYELLLREPKETFIPLSRSRTQKLREILDF